MTEETADVLVIGAGVAGLAAARARKLAGQGSGFVTEQALVALSRLFWRRPSKTRGSSPAKPQTSPGTMERFTARSPARVAPQSR